jgi:hypothetical protein
MTSLTPYGLLSTMTVWSNIFKENISPYVFATQIMFVSGVQRIKLHELPHSENLIWRCRFGKRCRLPMTGTVGGPGGEPRVLDPDPHTHQRTNVEEKSRRG